MGPVTTYPASMFVSLIRSQNVTYPQAKTLLTALQQMLFLNPSAKSDIYFLAGSGGQSLSMPEVLVNQVDGADLTNGLYYLTIGSILPNQMSPDTWEVSTLMALANLGGAAAIMALSKQMSYNDARYTPPQAITAITNLPGVNDIINKLLGVKTS